MQASAGYLASQSTVTTDIDDIFQTRTYAEKEIMGSVQEGGGFVSLDIDLTYEGDSPGTTILYSGLTYFSALDRNDASGKYSFTAKSPTTSGIKVVGLMNADFSIAWAKEFQGSNTIVLSAIDINDEVYVLEQGATIYEHNVYKFSNTGTCLWKTHLQASSSAWNNYAITEIVADGSDYVWLAGSCNSKGQTVNASAHIQVLALDQGTGARVGTNGIAGYWNSTANNYLTGGMGIAYNTTSSRQEMVITMQENGNGWYKPQVYGIYHDGSRPQVSGYHKFSQNTSTRNAGNGSINYPPFSLKHGGVTGPHQYVAFGGSVRYDTTWPRYGTCTILNPAGHWKSFNFHGISQEINNSGYGTGLSTLQAYCNQVVFTSEADHPIYGWGSHSGKHSKTVIFRHDYITKSDNTDDWEMLFEPTDRGTASLYGMSVTVTDDIMIYGQARGSAFVTKILKDGSSVGINGPINLVPSKDLKWIDAWGSTGVTPSTSTLGIPQSAENPPAATVTSTPDLSNTAISFTTTTSSESGYQGDRLTGGATFIRKRGGQSSNTHIYDSLRFTQKFAAGWDANFKNMTSYMTNDGRTFAEETISSYYQPGINNLSSFGFTIGGNQISALSTGGAAGTIDDKHVSWNFRRSEKFFDIVHYAGNETARSIPHSLGSVPGMIVVIEDAGTVTDTAHRVWHRSASTGEDNYFPDLGGTANANSSNQVFDGPHSSTHFNLGISGSVNELGKNYTAYLFAHNDGDGIFGPNGNQDVIKCGAYTIDAVNAISVDLGFEPQWVMIKKDNVGENWAVYDSMRGGGRVDHIDERAMFNSLTTNDTANEIEFNSTGFTVPLGLNVTNGGTSGDKYVYVAIRKGPLTIPTLATDVAQIAQQSTGTGDQTTKSLNTNFPVDFLLNMVDVSGTTTYRHYISDRLRGFDGIDTPFLTIHAIAGGANATAPVEESAGTQKLASVFADMPTSLYNEGNVLSALIDNASLALRRAPGFFDIITYDGFSGTQKFNHNLGVAPEMIWVKNRTFASNWHVWHSGLSGDTYRLYLNTDSAEAINNNALNYFNGSAYSPTATDIAIGDVNDTGVAGHSFVAYLFATCPGVSKVGSYTGNGTSQTIDCGFTSGARFVVIKSKNAVGAWTEFDTVKGIVAGNDPFIALNTNAYTGGGLADNVDPETSGFIVNQTSTTDINILNREYIFYAIA